MEAHFRNIKAAEPFKFLHITVCWTGTGIGKGSSRFLIFFAGIVCAGCVGPPKSRGPHHPVAFLAFSFANFLGSFWDTHFYRPLLVLVDEVETCTSILCLLWDGMGAKRATTHLGRVGCRGRKTSCHPWCLASAQVPNISSDGSNYG
jgi:hypothetical protein